MARLTLSSLLALGRLVLGGVSIVGSLSMQGCASAPLLTAASAQPPDARLPTRVRLLSNLELERSVDALLGDQSGLAQRLPPDVRQSGYTRNATQAWTSTSAVRWAGLIDERVELAVKTRLPVLWPCKAASSAQCRDTAITRLLTRAWRRPASTSEQAALRAVFTTARNDGEAAAVAALYSALLQAPSFLYATELGEPGRDTQPGLRRLTDYEVASELSYMLAGAPPDATLLSLAQTGALQAASVREEQALRILSQSETRYNFRRFVLEWLEVDRLLESAKDQASYPDYERVKGSMLEETGNYSDEVFVHHGASVRAMLDGGFAAVDPRMARYYGLDAFGPAVSLQGSARRGVLQHASVLAAHSHPDITSPVKRGDFILRRILCTDLPRPAELGLEIVMPKPKPQQTGRERMREHSVNPGCAACHNQLDPLGFSFENFDAAGHERALEEGQPPNTRVTWSFKGQTHEFASGLELSRWLAAQPETEDCFKRQAFRYFSAQTAAGPEAAFVELSRRLPEGQRSNLVLALLEYVKSDLFVERRAP